MSAAKHAKKDERSRVRSIFLGISLVIVAIVAVVVGRNIPLLGGGQTTTLSGVIGSEKRPFFEDEDVIKRLREIGFSVDIRTAGSREIAEKIDSSQVDFVFPSSEPATEKILRTNDDFHATYPFYSPMTVATFQPIVDVLKREGMVHERDGLPVLDMKSFVELASAGSRWRELGDEFPSPRSVQIRTTDIQTSNSAAMYLAILWWIFENEDPDFDGSSVTEKIIPFFVNQGFTSASSAAPFSDYLSQGIGAAPMVLVYEAQFLEEALNDNSRLADDQVLLYLDPTVQAKHGIVGITEGGRELAQVLATDEELQKLAAKHGFRTQDPAVFAEVMEKSGLNPPSDYVASVDLPSYDQLENLIATVGEVYGGGEGEVEE
ncbi:hypothetical protein [Corynebacterium cystitidis]|uniref:Extracellular solute-binding protein n=1 Tax=Corynebacterium cystitidis DSM 20524 TaxID=1121357 RepID=A0A1H9V9N0_9CORY|nr:hypothetical protein [Corynebacterium cystitidis]WJY82338.1 hypothetical protein CCYS_07050 [Corynebacterium cystitidis DSM 20524]SES18486.1 hypothetical protein SAMN05661109_02131 [Corynebacterium cystitidis DSM 20524]SNV76379.1 putative secreted protein [Corynebacterium cystitidis]